MAMENVLEPPVAEGTALGPPVAGLATLESLTCGADAYGDALGLNLKMKTHVSSAGPSLTAPQAALGSQLQRRLSSSGGRAHPVGQHQAQAGPAGAGVVEMEAGQATAA